MLLLHYMLKIIKNEAEFFYLLKLQIKTPVQDILTLHIAKLNRLSSYLTNVVICSVFIKKKQEQRQLHVLYYICCYESSQKQNKNDLTDMQ